MIAGLLSGVPMLYRVIAVALLVLAVFGYGWAKGAAGAQAKYESFVSVTEAIGSAAQARAAARAREAEQKTKELEDGLNQELAAARATYDQRLRDAYARGGRVPPRTEPAPVPHVSTESGGISLAECRARIATLEIEIAQLESRLSTAAVLLRKWKEYGAAVEEHNRRRNG